MARKKGTGSDQGVERRVAAIEKRVDEDRARLSAYLNKLIVAVDLVDDPLTTVGAADSVAKIGDALTRQTHLAVEALKVVAKRPPADEKDAEGVFEEIGLPFEDEPKEGSN